MQDSSQLTNIKTNFYGALLIYKKIIWVLSYNLLFCDE